MDCHSGNGQQCVVADLHLAEVLRYFEVPNAVILSLHYFFDLEPNRFSCQAARACASGAMYLQTGSLLATNTIVPLHAGNFAHFAQFERQPLHQGMLVTFSCHSSNQNMIQYGHPQWEFV